MDFFYGEPDDGRSKVVEQEKRGLSETGLANYSGQRMLRSFVQQRTTCDRPQACEVPHLPAILILDLRFLRASVIGVLGRQPLLLGWIPLLAVWLTQESVDRVVHETSYGSEHNRYLLRSGCSGKDCYARCIARKLPQPMLTLLKNH